MTTWQRLFPTNERARPDIFVDSSPLIDEVVSTYMDYPPSFGADFNLIRAVAEYGPQRVAEIDKRLAEIEAETTKLRSERVTLDALIAIVASS